MRDVIICEAIPFGYGPAAILQTLLPELAEKYDIVIASSGSTYDFFSKTSYTTMYVDSYDVPAIRRFLLGFSKRIKAVLSVENERFLYAARPIGIETIYVDLFEFIWDTTGDYMPFADKYVVYTLFEDDLKRKSLLEKGAWLIAPKVFQLPNKASEHFTLIHIGGLNSIRIQSDHLSDYANYVNLLVREIVRVRSVEVKVITSAPFSSFIHDALNEVMGVSVLEDVSYDAFKDALASCETYLTTPGIHAVLLGATNRKFPHLLFPANYTQYLQYQGFGKMLSAGLATLAAASVLDEKEGIEMVRRRIRGFDHNNIEAHVSDVLNYAFMINNESLETAFGTSLLPIIES